MLIAHGLRPTKQRRLMARLLFFSSGRHIDAQILHNEAYKENERLSLATVYNGLREFEQAGLLRRVAVPSERAWFDTDTGPHRHFYIQSENRVLDVKNDAAVTPPPGYRITHVDTVVHLQKIEAD
ncbi:Fur family transcriptional regulator [Pacificoceanicola onchidii]|uniref:Fur family transcriptional regulator n=1 Tax=Pacificoceanicola onchidii TaxID=2562685 RepID=UPI00197F78E9|nr:transcriptional repressor [Pacificoceanicola onchidii]